MKNFLLTCFLALLCLVGRYLAASSKVADSPGAELLHRSDSPNRGGAILSDTFRYSVAPLQDNPTVVELDNRAITQAPFSPVRGAGGTNGHPATHRASDIQHPTPLPTPQLSLELSGGERSKFVPDSRGLLTVDPAAAGRRGSENETAASLLGAPRSDDSRHPTPVTRHLSAVVDPTPGFSLVDNSTSQGQEEGNTPARVGDAKPADSLKIGDQLPSGIEFNSILNYDGESIRLEDYQGKYLILQFWAPTCTASIGSLPQMNRFNEKFGERVEILPLTVFSKKSIEETLIHIPALKELEIPLVVEAETMIKYFPHSVIPHFILISPNGEIMAITGLEDMTESNLSLLVSKNEVGFRLKKDTEMPIEQKAKLISESPQISNKNIWFQSAFTGYIPEVSGSLTQNLDLFSHIRIVNFPLYYHYQLAYSERSLTDYFGKNRIEMIGFDPEEMNTDKIGLDYTAWKAEGNHVFGYELIAPLHLNPYQMMREDLKRYLPHIEASVETKPRMVLALVQQEGESYPLSTGENKSYKSGPLGVNMVNYPLDGFIYHLNAMFLRNSPIPVMNLTGIDYTIDLNLEGKMSDLESLRSALQKNGFDLIEREEEIPVLVLKKISNPKFIGR